MSRMILLLIATISVWASVAWVMTELPAPDNGTLLILGTLAFLSTAVIWAVGGNLAVAQQRGEPRAFDQDDAKPKRGDRSASLNAMMEAFTPEQLAALEAALQRRRESYDEDDQILANRLQSELERSTRRDAR